MIDAGTVGAVRSQSLWHGIASAMELGSETTLSFCIPGEPYVCLGYHRSLEEIDLEACRQRGLPIIRRQIGGGPVYNDQDQLFFQVTLPAERAPARVDLLYERLLGPAVAAFRELGLPATLRGMNDIAVEDRRLSGTGAGRIRDAVTVVGNVIFRFPHRTMVEILNLPSETMRDECHRLMRRHVSSLEAEGLPTVSASEARAALTKAYSSAFELDPVWSSLSEAENREILRWEDKFSRPEWLEGPGSPHRVGRQVKICAHTWVFAAAEAGLQVEASVVGGRIDKATVVAEGMNGRASRIENVLEGQTLEPASIGASLAEFGERGRRVLDLLEPGLELR